MGKQGSEKKPASTPAAGADREARLAAALRENLQKRKAQARARRTDDLAQADADAANGRPDG
ncbi:MAG: hypothetical protein AAFZ05_12820 [Pseudomonadota bacterium]